MMPPCNAASATPSTALVGWLVAGMLWLWLIYRARVSDDGDPTAMSDTWRRHRPRDITR